MKKKINNETVCYVILYNGLLYIYFIAQNGESRSTKEDRTNLVMVTRIRVQP